MVLYEFRTGVSNFNAVREQAGILIWAVGQEGSWDEQFFFGLIFEFSIFIHFWPLKKKIICSPNLASPQEFATLDLETSLKWAQAL